MSAIKQCPNCKQMTLSCVIANFWLCPCEKAGTAKVIDYLLPPASTPKVFLETRDKSLWKVTAERHDVKDVLNASCSIGARRINTSKRIYYYYYYYVTWYAPIPQNFEDDSWWMGCVLWDVNGSVVSGKREVPTGAWTWNINRAAQLPLIEWDDATTYMKGYV